MLYIYQLNLDNTDNVITKVIEELPEFKEITNNLDLEKESKYDKNHTVKNTLFINKLLKANLNNANILDCKLVGTDNTTYAIEIIINLNSSNIYQYIYNASNLLDYHELLCSGSQNIINIKNKIFELFKLEESSKCVQAIIPFDTNADLVAHLSLMNKYENIKKKIDDNPNDKIIESIDSCINNKILATKNYISGIIQPKVYEDIYSIENYVYYDNLNDVLIKLFKVKNSIEKTNKTLQDKDCNPLKFNGVPVHFAFNGDPNLDDYNKIFLNRALGILTWYKLDHNMYRILSPQDPEVVNSYEVKKDLITSGKLDRYLSVSKHLNHFKKSLDYSIGSYLIMYIQDIHEKLDPNTTRTYNTLYLCDETIDLIKKYKNLVNFVFVLGKPEQIHELNRILDMRIMPIYDLGDISYKKANAYVNTLINIKGYNMRQRLPKNIKTDFKSLNEYLAKKENEKLGLGIFDMYFKKDFKKLGLLESEDNKNKLDSMIGLDNIKKVINEICNYIITKKKLSNIIAHENLNMHMIFRGNPGTAKTTVAECIADILYKGGVLKTNKLVSVGRADLIGEFIGQTSPKVTKIIESARGGVLFIDEAYSLNNSADNDFGHEVITILVEKLELIRNDTMVIFAGYPKEMDDFIKTNPGLASRINFKIDFPDYTEDELMKIADYMVKGKKMKLAPKAKETIRHNIKKSIGSKTFGNGRFIRSLIEKSLISHHNRISVLDVDNLSKNEIITIKEEDIELVKETKNKVGFRA